MQHEIYLAGGCFWGAEKYLGNIRGVLETVVGYANGRMEHPSYEQVKHENTGHAEIVRVIFDDERLPLETLLSLFYLAIDPTSVDRQGGDTGHQYRTGIYYADPAQLPEIEAVYRAQEAKAGSKLAVELLPLQNFFTAEEYHQKYLDKNPGGYCHIPREMLHLARAEDK